MGMGLPVAIAVVNTLKGYLYTVPKHETRAHLYIIKIVAGNDLVRIRNLEFQTEGPTVVHSFSNLVVNGRGVVLYSGGKVLSGQTENKSSRKCCYYYTFFSVVLCCTRRLQHTFAIYQYAETNLLYL